MIGVGTLFIVLSVLGLILLEATRTVVDDGHIEVNGIGRENGAPAKEMCCGVKLVPEKQACWIWMRRKSLSVPCSPQAVCVRIIFADADEVHGFNNRRQHDHRRCRQTAREDRKCRCQGGGPQIRLNLSTTALLWLSLLGRLLVEEFGSQVLSDDGFPPAYRAAMSSYQRSSFLACVLETARYHERRTSGIRGLVANRGHHPGLVDSYKASLIREGDHRHRGANRGIRRVNPFLADSAATPPTRICTTVLLSQKRVWTGSGLSAQINHEGRQRGEYAFHVFLQHKALSDRRRDDAIPEPLGQLSQRTPAGAVRRGDQLEVEGL
jgi:hypothetical protein